MSGHGPLTIQQWQFISSQPAGTPPPGQVSHLHSRSILFPWSIAILCIQLAIALIAVPLRLYTRWKAQHKLDVEDVLVVIALSMQIATDVVIMQGIGHSYCHHMWDVTVGQFMHGLKAGYIAFMLYGIIILLLKVAILLQFLRLFAPQREFNQFVWFECWGLIAINLLIYTIITGLAIGLCSPIPKSWNPFLNGHCLDKAALYKTTGVVNGLSDFLILVIPMPVIFRLKIPLRKKLVISSVFGVGIFALAAAILKTYYTWSTFRPPLDLTWNIAIAVLCYWGEFTMGILAFCLPVFPQFLRIMKERIRSQHSKEKTSTELPPSDVEMNVQSTRLKRKGPFMEVSLASFEVSHLEAADSAPSLQSGVER